MEEGALSVSTTPSASSDRIYVSVIGSSIVETQPQPAVDTIGSDDSSSSYSKSLPGICWDLSLWKFIDIDATTNDTMKVDTLETLPKSSFPRIDIDDSYRNIDIIVDIIIPVHNASSTIRETVASAMNQVWLSSSSSSKPNVAIHVCCYNDASTDDSWLVLQELYDSYTITKSSCSFTAETLTSNNENGHSADNITVFSHSIPTQLWISSSTAGSIACGPGYARNRAVQMRDTIITSQCTTTTTVTPIEQHFLCWLDSDDIMHPTRVYYQVHTMMQLQPAVRLKTLLGTNFDRFITTELLSSDNHNAPGDDTIPGTNTITPHYTKWANELSHERLHLERFREVTIIQPTWMMCRYRFTHVLHGYLECPQQIVIKEEHQIPPSDPPCNIIEQIDNNTSINAGASSLSSSSIQCKEKSFSEWISNLASKPINSTSDVKPWRLVHAKVETLTTILVAEDLRLFHEHLYAGGRLQRTITTIAPLVSYRHRPGISQSALTSRKLLLALRVVAFEKMILFHSPLDKTNVWNDKFIIWGAGRDGKDFFKALSLEARQRVYCFVDVDDAKIARGFYNYFSPTCSNVTKKQQTALNIPVIHFSLAARNPTQRSQLYDAWKLKKSSADDSTIQPYFGRIDKNQRPRIDAPISRSSETMQYPQSKRLKVAPSTIENIDPGVQCLDVSVLPKLPVVVCVTMYRTDGALESNVNLIDRVEGKDLWYFS